MPRIFALTAVVLLMLFRSKGLYPGYRMHGYELLRRRATATLWVGAVLCLGALLLSESWEAPLLLAAYLAIALTAQPPVRGFVRAPLWRSGAWGKRVAISATLKCSTRSLNTSIDIGNTGSSPNAIMAGRGTRRSPS